MRPVISVENAHLRIPIFTEGARSFLNMVLQKNRVARQTRSIHILKGINLECREGDRIGLLGSNGAGKSTFLRMLSGIYVPNEGKVTVRGGITSILTIGVGLDNNTSGRENIVFLGLSLGHSRKRMLELRDEIIEFIDIGDSIDMPVRTYSAGMLLRLAFAVSTIDTAEVLLIDEVIGTGDTGFQQKSLSRSAKLMEQCKVLMIASHDTNFLGQHCNRGLVFSDGEIVFDGSIEDAAAHYHGYPVLQPQPETEDDQEQPAAE